MFTPVRQLMDLRGPEDAEERGEEPTKPLEQRVRGTAQPSFPRIWWEREKHCSATPPVTTMPAISQ